MTIDELIERSHAMAVEKGWWPEGEQRSVVEQTNNFCAEISESWEEYRAGRMDTWWRGHDDMMNAGHDGLMYHVDGTPFKPEGFFVELADLCIRLADTMGAYGWRYQPLPQSDIDQASRHQWDLPQLILTLHVCVGCLGIGDDGQIGGGWETGAARTASGVINLCLVATEYHGVDMLALCELKMAYNATRSHRHGGKLA